MVVDDGSTDATPEALYLAFGLTCPEIGEMAIGPGPVRWLRLPHGGKTRTMNAALGRLQSEVVVTVDADTRLAPGSIVALRDASAADEQLVAATGVLTPVCAPNALGQAMQWFQTYEYLRNFLSRYAWMRLDSLVLISGAFAGFRRDAVLEVGGFDPDCLVEDYELIHRLKRFGSDQGRVWHTAVVGGARAPHRGFKHPHGLPTSTATLVWRHSPDAVLVSRHGWQSLIWRPWPSTSAHQGSRYCAAHLWPHSFWLSDLLPFCRQDADRAGYCRCDRRQDRTGPCLSPLVDPRVPTIA